MNHMKITAVDDDSTFLSILEMMFKKFKDVKLDAQFFSDSTHALEEVCNEQPDILFLDILLVDEKNKFSKKGVYCRV